MKSRLPGKVVLSDEIRVRLTSAGVVRVLRKNGSRCCPKNTHGLSTHKQPDGRKMLFKCPATANRFQNNTIDI